MDFQLEEALQILSRTPETQHPQHLGLAYGVWYLRTASADPFSSHLEQTSFGRCLKVLKRELCSPQLSKMRHSG